MTQTEEKMLFSNERAINCFIIASSYVAARAIFYGSIPAITMADPLDPDTIILVGGGVSTYGACLNPGIAMGISVAALFGKFPKEALKWFWLYGLLPFIGAILALIFYEFVYKKTQEMLNHDDDQVDDEGITPEGTLD